MGHSGSLQKRSQVAFIFVMYNVLFFVPRKILAVALLPFFQWQNLTFLVSYYSHKGLLIALQLKEILLAPSQIFLPVHSLK